VEAIQVCYNLTPENQEREYGGLREAMNYYNLEKGTIVTNNQFQTEQIEDKTIEIVPAWQWLINQTEMK
jgi:predicted AAA+ superfamily ATPase